MIQLWVYGLCDRSLLTNKIAFVETSLSDKCDLCESPPSPD